MDLKALRYFVTTAQLGSITQAATHLHVAQPAVSRQIRKLEEELGVRLLTRTAQGVSLTSQGEHLLERATPAIQVLNQTQAEVRNWDADPSGPVAVALMPAVGSLLAPTLVARVRRQFPKVQLRLSEGLSGFISDGVLNGQFDLGVFHADQALPSLAITPLLTEPMYLIGPGGQVDEGQPIKDLQQLAGYPLLLPAPTNALRRMIDRLSAEHDTALDIRENIDSTSIIKHLVAARLGYTIQCYSYVHEEVQRGDLSVRPFDIEGLSRNWSLASLAERPGGGALSIIAGIIREIAADLAETHAWRPPVK